MDPWRPYRYCIGTSIIYRVVPGSKTSLAMATMNSRRTAEVIVGFESTDFPGTILEAQRNQNWLWSLNTLGIGKLPWSRFVVATEPRLPRQFSGGSVAGSWYFRGSLWYFRAGLW